MKAEHELIRDTQAICCNWDCGKYPSTPVRCFDEDFKCVWYAIAVKVKNDNLILKTINNEHLF